MDHSIIPQEWKKFLATVQQFFPSAIIAGGALRDTICEKPVKDVDIFIADLDIQSDLRDEGTLQKLADALGIQYLTEDEKSDRDHIRIDNDFKAEKIELFNSLVINAKHVNSDYLDAECDQALYESFINYIVTIKYNSTIYQLIFAEAEPKSYVYNDFDFGICKVFFDGTKLTVTEEFWYDFEHRQITFTGKFSVGQAIHTLFTHRTNLIKKFPGWKVVIEDLRKRDAHEMPPSFIDAMRRVAEGVVKKEEKRKAEELKVTFTSAATDHTTPKLMYDHNSGYTVDIETGALYHETADGKLIRIHHAAQDDVEDKWYNSKYNKWGDLPIKIPNEFFSKEELWKMHGLDYSTKDYHDDLMRYIEEDFGDEK